MPPTSQMSSRDAGIDGVDVLVCNCIVSGGSKLDVEDAENVKEVQPLGRNPSEKICAKLTVLNLSGQSLLCFPASEDLANLQVLNLSNNEIPELPSALKSARFLRVLNVSKNKLKEFPNVLLEGLHIIKELNLSYNIIPVLPRPLCSQHLTGLSARDCHLAAFPSWILFEWHVLETLDLSSNGVFLKVTRAEAHQPLHSSCNSLRRVNFSNTYFSEIHVRILSYFRQLEHLDVSNYGYKYINSVGGFEDALAPTLKVLKAANVRLIEKVPLNKTQVEKVNLSLNSLVVLDEANISPYIRFLVLNDCYLSVLPDNFGDMVNLEYLNLSQNDLSSLPTSFSNLTELVHLDLYKNAFSAFPSEKLRSLKKLTCFDMCMNHLEIPSHPLGAEGPSYESLRAMLRSALPQKHSRKCGKVVYYSDHDDYDDNNDQDSGLKGPYHDYDSHEDLEGEDPDSSNPSPQTFTHEVGQDEEEDWGEMDSSSAIYNDATTDSSPQIKTHKFRQQEDEDWDEIDSSSAIFNDATNSLPMTGFTRPGDPFAGMYEEDWLQEALRKVPPHIRNSPFFYYRQAKSVLPPPSTLDTQLESEEEGQFDD